MTITISDIMPGDLMVVKANYAVLWSLSNKNTFVTPSFNERFLVLTSPIRSKDELFTQVYVLYKDQICVFDIGRVSIFELSEDFELYSRLHT